MKQRVLVASNRGPVSYQFGADGSLTGSRGGGGMISGVISGLAAVAPEADVTWICAALSDADRAAAHQPATGIEDQDGVLVRMLDIPPEVFDRAYNNVANSTLWFLHHLLFDTPSQPRFDRSFAGDWACYLAYNEAFAEALARRGPGRPGPGRPGPDRGSRVRRHPDPDPGLPPQPGPAAAAGPARRRRPRHRYRALPPHAVGAARLLPAAARPGGPGAA